MLCLLCVILLLGIQEDGRMRTEKIHWHDVEIEVTHGDAPENLSLHRFAVRSIAPSGVVVPLHTPRYGYHYVCKMELGIYDSFSAYLIARLDRDASPALLSRNASVANRSKQLRLL
jgi:hypothetical protein